MATKSSIKRLLAKKKLTGEEVGRLMILDLAEAYKRRLAGEITSEGLLTEAEKTAMVSKILGNNDIRVYNAYRDIHNFLINTQPFILMYSMQAELYFWRLFSMALKIYNAENAENLRKFEPIIMTKKQYNELKKLDFNKKITMIYTPEDVLIHAIKYYLNKYKSGEKTPFNNYFESFKKKYIINTRIKENYYDKRHYTLPNGRTNKDMDNKQWLTEIAKIESYSKLKLTKQTEKHKKNITFNDKIKEKEESEEEIKIIKQEKENTAPFDATLFNVLEYVEKYYYSENTKSKKTIFEFSEDYNFFYALLIKTLSEMPGLSLFKEIKRKDFFKKIFNMKDLYTNKIMGYPDIINIFTPEEYIGGGIAVLQHYTYQIKNRIDKKGYYKEKNPIWHKNLAESITNDKDNKIDKWRHTIKDALAECFAREKAFDIVSEFIYVPEIKIFYTNYNEIRDKINALNGIFNLVNLIIDDTANIDKRISKRTREKIGQLFEPINIKNLEPTEDAIESARHSISYETFQGGSDQFIESLKRAVK